MLGCPNCSGRLARRVTGKGAVHACPKCGGIAAGLAVLRKEHVAQEFIGRAWRAARGEPLPQGRPCPHCGRRMALVPADTSVRTVEIDVCVSCSCVWFDPGEMAELPREPPPPTGVEEPELSSEAREAIAAERIQLSRLEHGQDTRPRGPDEAWQWVPGLLGLPVECGVPAARTRPWVTWGVAALCVVVFAGALLANGGAALRSMFRTWGFVPAEWYRLAGATLVASFFLHAGVWHLVGNTYFLVVFGDNVEDQLGWRRFALLLLLAHLAGIAAHGLLTPDVGRPCVGASAGISGVIAYYAVAFPRARLAFLLLYLRWVRLPAWGAFALWVVLQLFGAWRQVSGFSNVSALGHLGGAGVGLAAALLARRRRAEALDLAGVRRRTYDRTYRTEPLNGPSSPQPPL